MTATARSYGGVPAEQRQARRRAALIEAALDVIAEQGAAKVTVRGVCGRARVTDRYFYENFADRDRLLCAVADESFAEATRQISEAIAQAPAEPEARVEAAVRAALAWITADPRRGRLFLETQTTTVLHSRRQEGIRSLAAIMAVEGKALLGLRSPSDQDAEMAALTLVGGGFEVLATWLRGDLDVTREHLTTFLIAMILTSADLATALSRSERSA